MTNRNIGSLRPVRNNNLNDRFTLRTYIHSSEIIITNQSISGYIILFIIKKGADPIHVLYLFQMKYHVTAPEDGGLGVYIELETFKLVPQHHCQEKPISKLILPFTIKTLTI